MVGAVSYHAAMREGGFRNVGGLAQRLASQLAKGKSTSIVRLRVDWAAIVGADDVFEAALRRANADVILHSGSLPADGGALINALKDLGWSPKIISTIFGQSTVQVMQVSGPDSFKSGNYWGLLPKAFTYCAKDKIGDRAYDKYLSRLKAFNPAAYEKIDHKVSLYIYDPVFVYRSFGHILPLFKDKTGIDVKIISQGTGQAIDTGRRGDADVLFVDGRAIANTVADWSTPRHYRIPASMVKAGACTLAIEALDL